MSIRDNIIEVQKRMKEDHVFADELRAEAVAAIYSGIDSGDAWKKFMRHFASNEIELTRLTVRKPVEDEQCDRYIETARAYLVANATCTTGTVDNLLNGVEDILDQTLPAQPTN